MIDPPLVQDGGAVIIRGAPLLAATYQAVLQAIAHRRLNGLPSADLQQLARALYRAHTEAMSDRGHELANALASSPCSNRHDSEFLDTAAASRLLGVGQR